MKKLIATGFSLLFLCSLAMGQQRLDLDAQIAQAQANIGDLEQIVCTTVESYPDRSPEIIAAFIRAFPNLAEDIVFTAISCLPAPISDELLTEIIRRAIFMSPGMAEAIVFGARRATDEALHPVIDLAGQRALKEVIANPDLVGLLPGQPVAPSAPWDFVDGSILSPARNN